MSTEILLPFLFETLVKSVLFLAGAALIDRLCPRASAARRHLVWCAALAVVLLLPLTRLIEPRWRVPIQRVTVELPPPKPAELSVVAPAPTAEISVVPAPSSPRWRWPSWEQITLSAWVAGAGWVLLTRLVGSLRLVALRRAADPIRDARVQGLAAETFRELGLRRRVALRLSPTGCVPLTWGTLRPVLMLPASALAWNDARLTAALRHEAGHIARGDHFTRWIATLACALYWPNPLVWFTARRLRTAQEQATDDLVLRAGSSPEEYAAQLFEVARALAARGGLARHAVAMASPSTLESRLLAIVDAQRDRRPLTLRAVAGGVFAVVLTLGLATAAQLQAQEKAPPSRAEETSEAAADRSEVRQVEIETKFVEITLGNTDGGVSENKSKDDLHGAKIEGVFSDPQFQVIVRALNQKKGVDLLTAPRVTTKSKQRAIVEIVRDFRSPSDWEKDPAGSWKPKEFETKKTGVTLEVTPEIKADGTIELQLKAAVVEFLGFVDLDADDKTAAKRDPSQQGAGNKKPDPTAEQPGKRQKPIFSERKNETAVTLQDGYTAAISDIMEGAVVRPFEKKTLQRKLTIFVSARILNPAGAAGPVNEVSDETKNPALAKARKIILPRVDFRDATVNEVLDFLRQKARDLDEEKQGLNLVLTPGPGAEARISLSLTNVPLSEALRYVASLAGLMLQAEPNALVLQPPADRRRLESKPVAPAFLAAVPFGLSISGKPGFVRSPHAPVSGYVDVRDFKPGTEVKCPYTGKTFRVPEAVPEGAAGLVVREWKMNGELLRRALGTDESSEAVKAALIERQVGFPEGSTLAWLPEKERLVSRNTRENLQRLEALIEKAAGQQAR